MSRSQRSQSVVQRMSSSKPPSASRSSRRTAASPNTKLRCAGSPCAGPDSERSTRRCSSAAPPGRPPSGTASVVRMSRSGLAAASSASASRRVGRKTSSASRMTTNSPDAARAAAFLAEPSPPCSFRRRTMRSRYGSRAASRSSVEPSSHTTISSGGRVCAGADSIASPITSAALWTAISTENVGRPGLDRPSAGGRESGSLVTSDTEVKLVSGRRRHHVCLMRERSG